MKKLFALCLLVLFTLSITYSCFAASNPTETTAIIIVNGQRVDIGNPIITLNEKIFLPLDATLLKMGIKNISANLKKGVIEYKKVEYAPLSSFSKIPNYKVFWDNTNKGVIITTTSSFNEVKTVMNKTLAAMHSVKKSEADFVATVAANNSQNDLSFTMTGDVKFDTQKKSSYASLKTTVLGIPIKTQQYIIDNTIYKNDFLSNTWIRKKISTDSVSQLNSLYNLKSTSAYQDSFYAALKVNKSFSNKAQTVIAGKIALKQLNSLLESGMVKSQRRINNLQFNPLDLSCMIYINNKTHLISKIRFMLLPIEIDSSTIDITITINKYNGNFVIKLPEAAKNATVSNLDSFSLNMPVIDTIDLDPLKK